MKRRRFPSLTVQILIGLVIGILVGWLEPGWGTGIKPMADIFLRMIKMIIAPLIFSTLVIGIAGTGDFKKVGRIGLKAIIYFEIATTIALLIGLVTVNVFKPGQYVPQTVTQDAEPGRIGQANWCRQPQSGSDFLIHVFPTSVVDAMARGQYSAARHFLDLLRPGPGGDRGKRAAARLGAEYRCGDDVPLHGFRDEVRAARRDGGDCRTRSEPRDWAS